MGAPPSDMVYKMQWLVAPIQADSVARHLEPVRDVRWKLEQCCRAVAPTGHLQRLLLKYGLHLAETAKEVDAAADRAGPGRPFCS